MSVGDLALQSCRSSDAYGCGELVADVGCKHAKSVPFPRVCLLLLLVFSSFQRECKYDRSPKMFGALHNVEVQA